MTRFIGLTGGIGAGKSTALEALRQLGVPVISSDAIVHELYETQEVIDAVVERFGTEVAPAGVVDRSALAARAFATDEDRQWLEQLLWPRVGARAAAWRSELSSTRPPIAVAVSEVPLLFEAGLDATFDATIVIVAPEGLRRERAQARGHTALDARGARQLTQDEKAARADIVIVNDGDITQLQESLSAVLDMLSQ